MAIDWPRFIEVIGAHQRYILTSHHRPDCDCLGSELAMCGVLEALGKEVRIVNPQKTPPSLEFVDPQRRILAIHEEIQPSDLNDAEILMVLDTSAWAQLGAMADVVRAFPHKKMILDHHVSEDDLGAEAFKDVQAEATGRLVRDAARQLGVKLTREIADAMFLAVATDTGWFRFKSTSGDTYRLAGELTDVGVVPQELYTQLYEQDTLARVKLVGRILARTESELDGRMVHTAAMREDFEATGALPSDTEDVINMTLAVRGTEVAVIFVEQPKGGFKLSFRSRSKVDCSQLAGLFNGGGHKAAAGAFIEGAYEPARAKVLDAVRAAMR